ncbi:hypothetical protein EV356DRAFT_537984 [Viridothelium virens]|uniref:Alpha N-terminal protein methyltransferase 1 n=1 Tax=Viridothelium virens TaxID=1048519 RepID=A0A6A6GS14_VIRVR|nr:hypothetical protein EV356DRAFT_537984 [Viridothelium virens]
MVRDENQFTPLSEQTPTELRPDASIDQVAAIEYWSTQTSDVDGMLGGYPQVSRIDLQGSANFLAKLCTRSKEHPKTKRLGRVVDCGAGIGRVTLGFLYKVAEIIDIVEPVEKFTKEIKGGYSFRELREEGRLGDVYTQGLESWTPSRSYDMIWHQWCLSQLTDAQVAECLQRLKQFLRSGGWMIVKENITTHSLGNDVYDETDSSVTRTDEKLRALFKKAGLKIVATELQRGFPKILYSVRMYALQPDVVSNPSP